MTFARIVSRCFVLSVTILVCCAVLSVTAKNQERREEVRRLMEEQGFKFYGFSYDYGYNITGEAITPPTDGDCPLPTNSTTEPEANVSPRLMKRACTPFSRACGRLFGGGGLSAVVLRTNGCTESATNDDVLFCIDKGCLWLDNFLCNDFERGQQDLFVLPPNFRIFSGSTVTLQKFGNQLWQVSPFEIIIVTSPGRFTEFFFDTTRFPVNCAGCSTGRGLTLNDDDESCVNIFGGICPRGYKFRLVNGRFTPIATIG